MLGGYITAMVTGVTLTSGAVSTSAAIPIMSSGERPRFLRIASTAAACIRLSKGATSALTTDLQVQPGDAVIVQVPTGLDTVSCIQVIATGQVQVQPLENM